MWKYITVFLLGSTSASDGVEFNYLENGKDWGDHFETCKPGPNQSPINLQTPDKDANLKDIKFSLDDFGRRY